MTAVDNAPIRDIDVRRIALEDDALRRIPRALAVKHDILSIAADGNDLTIAIPDTGDCDAIDRVRLLTGMHVNAVRAPRESIRARIADAYGKPEEAPAIRALDEIHSAALARNASDIHVEPNGNGGRVRERIDGILHETRMLPQELFAQVISRMKLLAGMDIAERRQPQDGRYSIDAGGRSIDARANSMPTIQGEKVAVRLLDRHAGAPAFEDLGMPAHQLAQFRELLHAPHGFIVVCGPTGSGKTTTLYAAMAERNLESQNLCSVEDPVELHLAGVSQVQINPRAGVTFASALRALLRQDPDVIMVGEMRDAETAAIAASAALSGQMVLATLHANDAARSIERLLELGVARHTLAAGLTAIVAQRLVRRLCAICGGCGCVACGTSGYRGRTGIFEMLPADEAMRECIASGGSSFDVAALARERGFRPMLAHGAALIARGETSIDELRRVLPAGGEA